MFNEQRNNLSNYILKKLRDNNTNVNELAEKMNVSTEWIEKTFFKSNSNPTLKNICDVFETFDEGISIQTQEDILRFLLR